MDTIAYVDRARPGAENMAIDRQLLEAAERTGMAYVRLYRWSEPTLSLGHFQAGIDRNEHPSSRDLAMVVRASGGGAIVHDQEWTYSIAIPVGRNKIGASKELYDLVHEALVDGLRGLGWDASQWTKPCAVEDIVHDAAASSAVGIACGGSKPSEPLLCFKRRSCGDIVCEGYKVVGSAQRRLGGSVSQHGSILCEQSEYAPDLLGLNNLSRRALAPVSAANPFTQTENPFTQTENPFTQTENPFTHPAHPSSRKALAAVSAANQLSDDETLGDELGAGALRLRGSGDSPIDMETFGSVVLSWVIAPLEREFGCRMVESKLEVDFAQR